MLQSLELSLTFFSALSIVSHLWGIRRANPYGAHRVPDTEEAHEMHSLPETVPGGDYYYCPNLQRRKLSLRKDMLVGRCWDPDPRAPDPRIHTLGHYSAQTWKSLLLPSASSIAIPLCKVSFRVFDQPASCFSLKPPVSQSLETIWPCGSCSAALPSQHPRSLPSGPRPLS